MAEPLHYRILTHIKSADYRPQRPRGLAKELQLEREEHYPSFRSALRELMDEGRVVIGSRGTIVLPTSHGPKDEFTGTYRHNRRGFGFVVPTDPQSHEDLFIPPGDNGGAMTGDIVRAKITSRGQKDGKAMYSGRITEIVTRATRRFVGTLVKTAGDWLVMPDGNVLTEPISTPDAASRHIKIGTKVVVELTSYPTERERAVGVITEVLGRPGDKDVDLRGVIIQYSLPEEFGDEVKLEARQAVDGFNPEEERANREDLSDEIICTIDPDDAKDYDDAISLRRLESGEWELGVHIADVSYFVKDDTALDAEARVRGNSCYFPGHVIPMLPEILSNGVCSLQENVPRFCKSVFITFDEDSRPVHSRFASTIIKSAKRLRYREAQAIIDAADVIPHPDGPRTLADYPENVISLLRDMNRLAKRLQRRRQSQGQLVLNLPQVSLVLDEEGRVVGTEMEDDSFTHTLIEMFMVEANEAAARTLNSVNVPFLRRIHPVPELGDSERMRNFIQVAGYKVPKELDRKEIQVILNAAKGKPEEYAINLAVLKSLTRAEYSPQTVGHFALASEHYCHFTSPIRRYADLTVHRLLDAYIEARDRAGGRGGRRGKIQIDDAPSYDHLVEFGRHLSFTERRAEDAERELRQIKILELLKDKIGEEFEGVITGIANFGIYVQLREYLIDGLIRYEDLLDDWWDVDAAAGMVRGQRTGKRIGIGDPCKAIIVRVDPPRRELELSISQITGRPRRPGEETPAQKPKKPAQKGGKQPKHAQHRRGGGGRNQRQGKPKFGRGRKR